MKPCVLASLAFLSAVEATSASTIKYDGPWKWDDINVKTATEIGDNGYPVTVKYTGTIAISGYNSSADVSTLEIPEKITWRAEEWGNNVLTYGDHLLLSVVTYDFDVVAIAQYAFEYYPEGTYSGVGAKNAHLKNLKAVTIPNTVKGIWRGAFNGLRNLESVVLPTYLERLDESCFSGCSSLSSIKLPIGIETIPKACFSGCPSLTQMTIPSTVKEIKEDAFEGGGLQELVLPENVTCIGYNAFAQCKNLKYVEIHGVPELGGKVNHSTGYGSAHEFNGTPVETLILGKGVRNIANNFIWPLSQLQNLNMEAVTNISGFAFSGSGIRSLVIPNSCQTIGESAFGGSTNLESLVLGNGLKDIGASAFYGCVNLGSLMFGTGLKDIGAKAFYGCGSSPSASKMSLVIPLSVQAIGHRAFNQMDNVTNLIVQGISKVSREQFEYTTNVVSLSFGPGVREMEDGFYCYRNNLKKLRFESDDLRRIGKFAFSSCASLEELVLPQKLEEIGSEAFRNAKRLKDVHVADSSLTLPKSLVKSGEGVFHGCESITNSVVLEEGFSALSDSMFRLCKSIPSVVLPSSLKTIGEEAFYGCESLKNIRIPFGVEVIGNRAFSSCSSMDEIVLEDGLTVLGDSMFSYSSVQEITIPKTVKTMGLRTFSGCNNLRHVILEDGVSRVADSMFSSCSSLQDVAIPSSVKLLGQYSFQNCTGLTSVNLSEGLCKIGKSAFQGCVGLRAISFPESVSSIGNTAFSGCTSLSTVSFPSGIAEVGVGAFSGCSVKSMLFNNGNGEFLDQFSKESLRTLFLGKSASGITGGLLSDCSALETIMAASTNPSYCTADGVLYDKAKTTLIKYPCALANTEYTIPSSVRTVDESAFAYASALSGLHFADAIDAIGNAAFDWCLGLQTITFGGTVGRIGDGAFMICPSLEALYFKGDSPSWGENQFWYATPTVYAEKDTAGWNAASSRVGFVVSYIGGGETAVPNAWIDKYPSFLAAARGDYQTAADSVGANGVTLRESYVAGLDPTDEASKFTAILTIENGEPKISWSPDLSEDAVPRTYTIYGKPSLDADEQWQVVTDGNKSKMKFFKVTVDLE